KGASGEAGDRMACAPPEERWGLALLPLQHRDPRLLGGPRRLCGAPRQDEDAANPRVDRAGRGLLSGPTAVPRVAQPLPSVVSAAAAGRADGCRKPRARS